MSVIRLFEYVRTVILPTPAVKGGDGINANLRIKNGAFVDLAGNANENETFRSWPRKALIMWAQRSKKG